MERCIDVTWWFRKTVSSIADSFALVRLIRGIRRKLSGADTMPCGVGGYSRETAEMIIQSAGRADGGHQNHASGVYAGDRGKIIL